MSKYEIMDFMLKKGVISEQDVVDIRIIQSDIMRSVYITILAGLGETKSYYYNDDKLVFVSGTNIEPIDVEIMKGLDVSE